jgi:hypothetical protein
MFEVFDIAAKANDRVSEASRPCTHDWDAEDRGIALGLVDDIVVSRWPCCCGPVAAIKKLESCRSQRPTSQAMGHGICIRQLDGQQTCRLCL